MTVREALALRARCIKSLGLALSAGFLGILAAPSSTWAQAYPQRPIALIVPFVPGGAADTTARILADSMAKSLGQSIVVENVSGAGGSTGSTRGKNAKPDGYTIGLGHMGTHAAAVAINPNLAYDPRTDFDYLGLVATTPNIIFMRKDFPANTLQELAVYAKSKPGILKMGHSGIGAASHITCILFFQLIEAEPTYVSYRGFGQTINDVLSGTVDGSCDLVASVTQLVAAGSIKAFVVGADERSPAVPGVRTGAEVGLPGFKVETWTGLYAPKGLPAPILVQLREAVAKALDERIVQERLGNVGAAPPRPEHRGGDYMQKLVSSEVERWTGILKKAGVSVQN